MDYKKYQVKNWKPDIRKAALLIIDMQNYFIELAKGIIPNIKKLINTFRKLERPIVYTMHTHINLETDGGLLVQWWGKESMEVFTPGRWEWMIIEEIKPSEEDIIINTKTRYSAFYKTELEKILKSLDITDLVITGVMTNYCCETTARDAFNRDFRVFFIADATATDDPFLHNATLCNLASGFAVILETEETIKFLREQAL